METTRSFDGIDPAVLSRLNAARAAAVALAEERRLAEECAQQQIAKSDTALHEASEAIYQNEEAVASSDSYYGPGSAARPVWEEKEIDEVSIGTPDSEGLSTRTVVKLDENGLAVIGSSSSCVRRTRRMIRERRKRGMRVWLAGDAMELLRSLIDSVCGCFHGILCMLGMRRNNLADETTSLIGRAEV